VDLLGAPHAEQYNVLPWVFATLPSAGDVGSLPGSVAGGSLAMVGAVVVGYGVFGPKRVKDPDADQLKFEQNGTRALTAFHLVVGNDLQHPQGPQRLIDLRFRDIDDAVGFYWEGLRRNGHVGGLSEWLVLI